MRIVSSLNNSMKKIFSRVNEDFTCCNKNKLEEKEGENIYPF